MEEGPTLSRREALKLAAAGLVGLLAGAGGVGAVAARAARMTEFFETQEIPFYGLRQAGILTPKQTTICLAAFDLTTDKLQDVRKLFIQWTEASARLARGEPVGDADKNAFLPPADTGETQGLSAARTTVTFGFGPSFFDGRFGLSAQRPGALIDLPAFRGDELSPEWSGGDVVVQICSDDRQVAFHALRNLARIARGNAVVRWMQEGFQRSDASDPAGSTPRNLFGFKDGTNNPDVRRPEVADEVVWVQPGDGPAWMTNGTYMVVRRIRMRIEVWDRTPLNEQEAVFGRRRDSGAPFGAKREFDPPEAGKLPADSHVALAHMNGKIKIFRRSYSYSNGLDPKTGQLDAGLLFICFNRDPRRQFVPIQTLLSERDRLNEYIAHVGSAIFACPPGARQGGYIGETLF